MAPSDHTFSDDTRPHYSHHSARALPISKSQNGSMCDASPGDDRDGARLTRSCPIHLTPLQLYAEIYRRSRGDVAAYIFASVSRNRARCSDQRPAQAAPPRHRTRNQPFRLPLLYDRLTPRPVTAQGCRLIYIVSTEPMREKFTEPTPRPSPQNAQNSQTHDGRGAESAPPRTRVFVSCSSARQPPTRVWNEQSRTPARTLHPLRPACPMKEVSKDPPPPSFT